MKPITFRMLFLVAAMGLSPALPADEIGDQIDTGKQAYESGELRQAIQELQYAIAQIQERLDNSYVTLMPKPLDGWTAEEPQAQTAGMAMMGGGTQVSRRYVKADGGESVELRVTADSPFLQAMSMMMSNPMMLRSEQGTKLYRHGKHRGMLKHRAGADEWEINLMVGGRILVQVEGHGMNSVQPLEAYLQALDLETVEAAFSN